MIRRPPISTRTDPRFPYPTHFRSLTYKTLHALVEWCSLCLKEQILKKLGISLALLAAAATLTMPSLASAKQWKEIKIATEAGYAPFEYRNTKGQLEGFDIDIGNEICARLKTKCVWIDQSFDSLIPGLTARRTEERRVGNECVSWWRYRW